MSAAEHTDPVLATQPSALMGRRHNCTAPSTTNGQTK
jgi:hypothetical protein